MALRRHPDVEAAPLKNELLLFRATDNKFFVMNATAAYLWQRLEQPSDEAELAARVCAAFSGVSGEQARADVADTIRQMLDLNLIRSE
jgi:hypothetical protein